MRRLMVVPLAGLLALSAVAPVAAGSHVVNQSGSFVEAYGTWSAYDEDTGAETYGEFIVDQQTGDAPYLEELFEQSGVFVSCSGGEVTPKDTTGGDYGFIGTVTYGYGDVSLSVGKKLAGADISGEITVEIDAIDDCAGTFETVSVGTQQLSAHISGTGDLVSFKSSESIKVPGSLNGHDSYKGTQRAGAGTIDFGSGAKTFDDAAVAQVTWTDHCNGAGCGY